MAHKNGTCFANHVTIGSTVNHVTIDSTANHVTIGSTAHAALHAIANACANIHFCCVLVQWEIYTLFKAFKQYNIQPLPPAAAAKTQPRCVPVVIQGTPPEGWMPRPAAVGIASQQDALPYGGLMYSNY
jgi:hypothetical protein